MIQVFLIVMRLVAGDTTYDYQPQFSMEQCLQNIQELSKEALKNEDGSTTVLACKVISAAKS